MTDMEMTENQRLTVLAARHYINGTEYAVSIKDIFGNPIVWFYLCQDDKPRRKCDSLVIDGRRLSLKWLADVKPRYKMEDVITVNIEDNPEIIKGIRGNVSKEYAVDFAMYIPKMGIEPEHTTKTPPYTPPADLDTAPELMLAIGVNHMVQSNIVYPACPWVFAIGDNNLEGNGGYRWAIIFSDDSSNHDLATHVLHDWNGYSWYTEPMTASEARPKLVKVANILTAKAEIECAPEYAPWLEKKAA